ncbi:hypothetical protein STEG23_023915, partial [Scotinomys teguina]
RATDFFELTLYPATLLKVFISCRSSLFIYMVYYIDRLSYVEPSLHLWDKAYLVMVDNVFDVFLESNQLFVSLILCIVFFVSILLISALNLIISLHLFLLGDFAPSSSRAFSFNMVDLSIGESGVLKSPTINVWGLMYDLSFSNVSFTYVGIFLLVLSARIMGASGISWSNDVWSTPGSSWSNIVWLHLGPPGPMASGCSWVLGGDWGSSQVEIELTYGIPENGVLDLLG